MVVRPLNQCPDLEEPPALLGALEAEQAPPAAVKLINVLELHLTSGTTSFRPRAVNQLKCPPEL